MVVDRQRALRGQHLHDVVALGLHHFHVALEIELGEDLRRLFKRMKRLAQAFHIAGGDAFFF